MGFRYSVKPLRKAQLAALADPQSANQPEALPWVLYDTQSLANGGIGPLVFFQTVNVDKTLSNMEGPGQLPDPQYFQIFYWGVDFLLPAFVGTGAIGGPIADIANILFTTRATWTFNISNKRTGPFPLSFMHSSGGPTGFYAATLTAPASKEYGNNGIFDGGFCVNGALVIPPKLGFDVTIAVAAAVTLTDTPLNVRAWQAGVLYRKVL